MNICDQFFDKFDLLPEQYKRQLDFGSATPTLQDVDAMWELAQEDMSLKDLCKSVNRRFYPDRYKKQVEDERREARALRLANKAALKEARRRLYERRLVPNPHYRDPTASDLRLIGEAKAHKLLTEGKIKVVNRTSKYLVVHQFVRYETRFERNERLKARELAKFGYDPYKVPDKNQLVKDSSPNTRLHNGHSSCD